MDTPSLDDLYEYYTEVIRATGREKSWRWRMHPKAKRDLSAEAYDFRYTPMPFGPWQLWGLCVEVDTNVECVELEETR